MTQSSKHLIAAAAVAALMAPAVSDAAIVQFGSLTGVWSHVSPSGLPSFTSTGDDTANPQARWGVPNGGSGKSGYDFNVVGTPLNVVLPPNPTNPFNLGTFTHHNFPIDSGTSITGIRLTLTAQILIDNQDGNGLQDQGYRNFVYQFSHWETPNNDPICANGGANGSGVNTSGCADRVIATINTSATQFFTVDNEEYTLRILGFVDGSGNTVNEFWTREGQANTATLKADIASRSTIGVPEPMTLALFGTALFGLGVAYRRRERA